MTQKSEATFDDIYRMVFALNEAGYSMDEIGGMVATKTGMYFDFEDSTNIFYFDDGVVILSGMDGIVAYKGEKIE